MKFKRNEGRINVLIFFSLVWLALLLLNAFFGFEPITITSLAFFVMGFLMILTYILSVKGLFCDMVYCDEKGIKIVSREKTSEYAWNEIFRIQVISGSGPAGYTVVAIDGKEFDLFPEPSYKFIEYVKVVSPYLDIK